MVTSVSYMVYVTNHTQSDRSRKLSFSFGIEHTYMISHVIVLFGFRQ